MRRSRSRPSRSRPSRSRRSGAPVDAGLPADEGEQPPKPHHDRVPVVVVAQQGSDEEGQEDRDRTHEEQPGEPSLLDGGGESHS